MSNDFINKIASDLQKNGKEDLAAKWSKLAQDAGLNESTLFNPNIESFARPNPTEQQQPKRVQHSYQVTVEGPAGMDDITIMKQINDSVAQLPETTVKGYQFLFKKEI